LRGTLPELGELQQLFAHARRGLEFTGATAVQAARLLEAIGPAQGLERLILFLQLINTLLKAPTQEAHLLASACYAPPLDERSSERINKAFDYLLSELTGDLRLSVIAQRLHMSEPGFSRFFKRITGHGFIDLMRKLRVQRACRLLLQTEMSVADICFEVGYANLSNFNRHFRIEMDQTPSEYRRAMAMTLFNRNAVHPALPFTTAH
jgi:AraC-like DNA-binding protein